MLLCPCLLSVEDHFYSADGAGHSMLYGEAGMTNWPTWRTTKGGANVWIRSRGKLCPGRQIKKPGTLTVKVTVANACGELQTATKTITVNNVAPTVDITEGDAALASSTAAAN